MSAGGNGQSCCHLTGCFTADWPRYEREPKATSPLSGTAATFVTFDREEPRTSGVLLDCRRRDAGHAPAPTQVQLFYALTEAVRGATAVGKLAVLGPDGVRILQMDSRGNTSVVDCGNAVAAVAAHLGLSQGSFVVHGPDQRRRLVNATIGPRGVQQIWSLPSRPLFRGTWAGRPTVVMDALNPYVILKGPLPPGTDPEQVRRDLTGDVLTGKLAVVTGDAVEFFVAGRVHGAAPMTGLAALAIARRAGGWLADALPASSVSYHTPQGVRTQALPSVSITDDTVSIEMPSVQVKITALRVDLGVAA